MSQARLAAAVARMDPDQLWALRVIAATERRLRTHYQLQPNTFDPTKLTQPMHAALTWALENVR